MHFYSVYKHLKFIIDRLKLIGQMTRLAMVDLGLQQEQPQL